MTVQDSREVKVVQAGLDAAEINHSLIDGVGEAKKLSHERIEPQVPQGHIINIWCMFPTLAHLSLPQDYKLSKLIF